jgi:hypothetical protein
MNQAAASASGASTTSRITIFLTLSSPPSCEPRGVDVARGEIVACATAWVGPTSVPGTSVGNPGRVGVKLGGDMRVGMAAGDVLGTGGTAVPPGTEVTAVVGRGGRVTAGGGDAVPWATLVGEGAMVPAGGWVAVGGRGVPVGAGPGGVALFVRTGVGVMPGGRVFVGRGVLVGIGVFPGPTGVLVGVTLAESCTSRSGGRLSVFSFEVFLVWGALRLAQST